MTGFPLPEGIGLRHPDRIFVGGAWVESRTGRRIDIVSPNSETMVAQVAEAGEADMDAAVAAARKAFDAGPWPYMPPGVVNLVCGHREASDHLVCSRAPMTHSGRSYWRACCSPTACRAGTTFCRKRMQRPFTPIL